MYTRKILLLYMRIMYIIRTRSDVTMFFTIFFFFFLYAFRSIHTAKTHRAGDLKTFYGYLGVDLAATKAPQKVICHPLHN